MSCADENWFHAGACSNYGTDTFAGFFVEQIGTRAALVIRWIVRSREPRLRHTEARPAEHDAKVRSESEPPWMSDTLAVHHPYVRYRFYLLDGGQQRRDLPKTQQAGYVRKGHLALMPYVLDDGKIRESDDHYGRRGEVFFSADADVHAGNGGRSALERLEAHTSRKLSLTRDSLTRCEAPVVVQRVRAVVDGNGWSFQPPDFSSNRKMNAFAQKVKVGGRDEVRPY